MDIVWGCGMSDKRLLEGLGTPRSRHLARAASLVFVSVTGGALIGGVYAVALSWSFSLFAAPFGAVFGAVIGLLASPITVSAMMFKRLDHAWMIIYPVSLAAAAFGGYVDYVTGNGNGGPGVGFLATLGVFVVACVISARALPRRWNPAPAGACSNCCYDLRGLSASTCPECGNAVVSDSSASDA